MKDSTRSAPRRNDGLTPLALAAGLAFGHVVSAMAESAGADDHAFALVAAFVFATTASAGTVCALFSLAGRNGAAPGRQQAVRWVVALGAGWLAALGPGLF